MPAAALLALAALGRWALGRLVEARYARRRRFGADGIAEGAVGLELTCEGPRAALLLHGFGDTPQSLAHLAGALHARGIAVSAPLLPGHGRSLAAFAASGASGWIEAARAGHDALRSRHDQVAVVGLSMGAALGALLCAEHGAAVPAFVALAPYFVPPARIRRLARGSRWISLATCYLPSGDERSIRDAGARASSLGYGIVTAGLLRELVSVADRAWEALPAIRTPTLIVHSHGDNRIASADVERAVVRFAVPPRLIWLERSGHVISVDHEREMVVEETVSWLERHWARAATRQAAG